MKSPISINSNPLYPSFFPLNLFSPSSILSFHPFFIIRTIKAVYHPRLQGGAVHDAVSASLSIRAENPAAPRLCAQAPPRGPSCGGVEVAATRACDPANGIKAVSLGSRGASQKCVLLSLPPPHTSSP